MNINSIAHYGERPPHTGGLFFFDSQIIVPDRCKISILGDILVGGVRLPGFNGILEHNVFLTVEPADEMAIIYFHRINTKPEPVVVQAEPKKHPQEIMDPEFEQFRAWAAKLGLIDPNVLTEQVEDDEEENEDDWLPIDEPISIEEFESNVYPLGDKEEVTGDQEKPQEEEIKTTEVEHDEVAELISNDQQK